MKEISTLLKNKREEDQEILSILNHKKMKKILKK